ncbi:MAG: flagellar biosynthesis anti-sigma factor FlgM [Burkholderiaceae bacterium]
MKINDSGSIKKPAATSVAATQTSAGKGAEKAAATAAATDSVRLSSQAKALSSTSSAGVFDAKKVEEIKAAIANGSFQVDASKVADGLIDSVKDLMNQKRK